MTGLSIDFNGMEVWFLRLCNVEKWRARKHERKNIKKRGDFWREILLRRLRTKVEISILGLDLWYDTTFVQPDTFLQHWYWKIQRFGEVGAIQCPTASVTSHIMTTYNNLRCLAAKSCTDRSPWRRLTTAALVSYWQLTNIASYDVGRREAWCERCRY